MRPPLLLETRQKATLGKRLTGRIIPVEDDDAEEGADRFRAQDS